MKRPAQRTAREQKKVDEWNARIKVGDEIHFWPISGEDKREVHKTRTEASVLSGHTAVVWLEGKSGCVALDNCAPIIVRPANNPAVAWPFPPREVV
jgi:hypothetical protein